MDYTEVSNSIRMMMKAQGIDEMYIDKEETLYYDESGNVKRTRICHHHAAHAAAVDQLSGQ